jgi:putative endopeptidase
MNKKHNNTAKISFHSFEKEFEKTLKTNKKTTKKLINKIIHFNRENKYTPQNDFYSWVNSERIKHMKVKKDEKYIVQFDDFRIVQHKVYLELFDIIKNYLKKDDKSAFYKCLKTFYNSSQKMSTLSQIKTNALEKIKVLDDLRSNKENVWKCLALFNKSELYSWGCPIVYNMLPDQKEPTIFRCNIHGPQFSLVDMDVYFDDGTNKEYKSHYKNTFLRYINNLFHTILGPNHGLNAIDVFNIEVKMITAYTCQTEKENKNNYNHITKEVALKHYNFNFEEFCKELGFKKIPNWFVCSSLNYLLCGTKLLLKEWDSNEFRTYWIYNYLRQISLSCAITKDIVFDFNGKFIRGEKENYSYQGINGIFALGLAFNTFLSNEYIKNYSNEKDLLYLQNIAEDLKLVFIRIVKRNTWLSPETKKYALKKLYHLKLIIGSPEVLRNDPLLPYTDNFLENMLMICDWRFKQTLHLEGKSTKIDVSTIDWSQFPPKFTGDQSYVVNAAYTPSKNSIYVPLGYIQYPFVDLKERGIEYNLAHLGFTLSHEMSHSLDDWGSQYDYLGRLNEWWTKEDKVKFKRIENDVMKQYEFFAKRDGIIFDAKLSLGEDMADISGMAICSEYLRDFHQNNDEITPIRELSFKEFYVYYAHQMREKLSKQALITQLKTNPHPLDQYRTNVPLSRLKLFRSIYNIKEKDKMWWHNTNTIW